MVYTVASMEGKKTKTGASYTANMGSHNPDYQCTILAVTKEQFDALSVGDKIEITIAPHREKAEEVLVDCNAELKTRPVMSSDCRGGDHRSCEGEESALWPDGDQTMRKCSCECHGEADRG